MKGENNRELAKEAGIPDGYGLMCALVVGYAADENKFTVGELSRKGTVSYID